MEKEKINESIEKEILIKNRERISKIVEKKH